MENRKEQFIEALRTFDDFATVPEWARKFNELYPKAFENSNKGKYQQAKDSIWRHIGKNDFSNLECDSSGETKKYKYVSDETKQIEYEAEKQRGEIEESAEEKWSSIDKYRSTEMDLIVKTLNNIFKTNFEKDHAVSIHSEKEKAHHPDNFQLLLKNHNGKKLTKNWKRFTFKEQENYIRKVIELQCLLKDKIGFDYDEKLLNLLLERLKAVF